MAKYTLSNELIQDSFDLEVKPDFHSVREFRDWIQDNPDRAGIGNDLKSMLLNEVRKGGDEEEEKLLKNATRKIHLEWMEANCLMEGETPQEADDDAPRPVPPPSPPPESAPVDYQAVKEAFEAGGYRNMIPLGEDDLDYTEFTLRDGGLITQHSGVMIYVQKPNLELDASKILIASAEGNAMLAMGYLEADGGGAYKVVFDDKERIEYDGFRGARQARLVVFDTRGGSYSCLADMNFVDFAVEENRPLCIDFGTSNTTAGSYGILNPEADEAELVRFIDVTVEPPNTDALLLPTIVYVDDCSDPRHIKYLFGYEARKKIENERYESRASMYFEIKRWMSSPDEAEPVRDERNNQAFPRRREIIKAYIDYIIECAEQYFSTRFLKIHISAPVKLKGQFIRVFTELYQNEKRIMPAEDSIDEGLAIVYDQLVSIAYARNDAEPDADGTPGQEKKSILIMDCGGGTTDLASCEFACQETKAGKTLELDTCFANGNSNFGGNNITYRIMQLLKIKIAARLQAEDFPDGGEIIRLIDKSENEILGLVENAANGKGAYDSDRANSEVYKKFLDAYERAEKIIPTRYLKNGKFKTANQIKRIKRNFYYLWRRAEQIKIDFYRSERVMMDFDKSDADASFPIVISNEYLYTVDADGILSRNDRPFGNVSITIKEINRVICGDIYALLVGLFQDGRLGLGRKKIEDFDYYKLSGQSCKISLFSELIKEYIPGRKLRPAAVKGANEKSRERETSEDLKLDCILGCIYYNKDQMRPEMEVRIRASRPEIIYTVKVKGQHTGDRVLLDCNAPNVIRMAAAPKNTREVPLLVVGRDGVVERDFVVSLVNSRQPADEWSEEDIEYKIRDISGVHEETVRRFIRDLREKVESDKSVEGENIIVAAPAKDEYGFFFMQIFTRYAADGNLYKVLRCEYENFEDASKTFFDGRR
ncbi:MAG: hypothetical protein IJQ81_18560 [Oscillibacter sp.]|nr:hypothetical protein [Oscillibacter sp.]